MEQINKQNYDSFIGSGKEVLFVVGAWCGHCQASKPAFNVLSTKLDGFKCGITDVAEEEELATTLGITNLPVIIVYKDGQEVGRTTKVDSVDNMKTWVEGLTQ